MLPSADPPDGQPSFLSELRLVVSVPDQRLALIDGVRTVAEYPVSTSKFGLGTEPGSYRTPLGRFAVSEMIGDGAPPGMVFVGREPTGVVADQGGEDDHVLTRILWLDGIEPLNANTHDRFIYIHGTNQEEWIGTPASHGCVRMRNADIIDLFTRVTPGTTVEIVA